MSRVHLFADGHRWSIHRPCFYGDWYDEGVYGIELSWGDGNSDPVWLVGAELHLPGWLTRRLP